MKATTHWRIDGPAELARIDHTGMKEFSPPLPEQRIFDRVTTEGFATKIARNWNAKASGGGFQIQFEVSDDHLLHYEVQEAGGRTHLEYWIPAEDLPSFNAAFQGQIVPTEAFK